MSLRVRLTAATLCSATLVAAIATIQLRNADADNPQPAATATQPTPPSAATDSVYLNLATPQQSTQAAEQKVRDALEKPITVEFKHIALKDAVNDIAAKCSIKATLNIKALNEEGIADDEPITLTRRYPAPARSVLNTLLGPLELAITVENDKLTITTQLDASGKKDLRLYDTARLVKAGFSHESLIKLMQEETSGPWYPIDGSGGTVNHFENVLTVYQTEKVHAEATRLLNTLQRIVEGPEKSGTAPLLMTPEDRKVYATLSIRVTADFQDTPLTEVAVKLGMLTNIDILVHAQSLAEEGIATDEPVTTTVKEMQLKSVLEQILEPLGLDYYVVDGTVTIVTAIVAEERQRSFAFNVRDFHDAGHDTESLVKTLIVESSGPWQEIDATGGTISNPVPGLLIIRQTWRVIEECALHLENLRTALKQSSPSGQLPKSTRDRQAADLILKQYYITSLPIQDVRNAIPRFVAADSWKSDGGRGELAIIESRIIVRQTRRVHEKIEEFLKKFGEGSAGSLGGSLGGGIGSGLGVPNRHGIGSSFFNVK